MPCPTEEKRRIDTGIKRPKVRGNRMKPIEQAEGPWFMSWYDSFITNACKYSLQIGLINWGCTVAQMINDGYLNVSGLVNYLVGSLLVSMWVLKKWNL